MAFPKCSIRCSALLWLYKVLTGALERRSKEIDSDIPLTWYSFNTWLGEPTCLKRAADRSEIVSNNENLWDEDRFI